MNKKGIKSISTINKKYVNRDINAVKNMIKIISSYLTKNKKHIIFVQSKKVKLSINTILI